MPSRGTVRPPQVLVASLARGEVRVVPRDRELPDDRGPTQRARARSRPVAVPQLAVGLVAGNEHDLVPECDDAAHAAVADIGDLDGAVRGAVGLPELVVGTDRDEEEQGAARGAHGKDLVALGGVGDDVLHHPGPGSGAVGSPERPAVDTVFGREVENVADDGRSSVIEPLHSRTGDRVCAVVRRACPDVLDQPGPLSGAVRGPQLFPVLRGATHEEGTPPDVDHVDEAAAHGIEVLDHRGSSDRRTLRWRLGRRRHEGCQRDRER